MPRTQAKPSISFLKPTIGKLVLAVSLFIGSFVVAMIIHRLAVIPDSLARVLMRVIFFPLEMFLYLHNYVFRYSLDEAMRCRLGFGCGFIAVGLTLSISVLIYYLLASTLWVLVNKYNKQ